MVVQLVSEEILDPWTGELVPTTSVDSLWELYETAKAESQKAYLVMQEVRLAFEKLSPCPEDTYTARATGDQHRVKVIYPSDCWDSKQLAETLNAYPQWASKYLKISKVTPIAKEVDKLRNETRPDDFEAFEQFKKIVLGANTGPSGLARLEIEK